jgi:hypothetical protein
MHQFVGFSRAIKQGHTICIIEPTKSRTLYLLHTMQRIRVVQPCASNDCGIIKKKKLALRLIMWQISLGNKHALAGTIEAQTGLGQLLNSGSENFQKLLIHAHNNNSRNRTWSTVLHWHTQK